MSTTILDGGMGQELIKRSGKAPTPLWATQVMIDAPHLVREVHDDFFAAGAEIATTNTYALHHDRLQRAGLDHRLRSLHEAACRMAVDARDAYGTGLVAGAIGPLGGSYMPQLAPGAAEAAGLYSEIVAIQAPYVDFFLLETMSSLDQARGALLGALTAGKPVWLAVTVQDDDGTRLRSGEPVADILPLVTELGAAALLVNCSSPEAVSVALPMLSECSVPLGAYANGFVRITSGFLRTGATVQELDARPDLDPKTYAAFAKGWVASGATIVGGCCEVGPAHIAELARSLKE